MSVVIISGRPPAAPRAHCLAVLRRGTAVRWLMELILLAFRDGAVRVHAAAPADAAPTYDAHTARRHRGPVFTEIHRSVWESGLV